MPPPPFLLYSGIGILAAITSVTLLASLLTLIASWVLLRLYRRSVKKWMAFQAAPEHQTFQTTNLRSQAGASARGRVNYLEAAPNRPIGYIDVPLANHALRAPIRGRRSFVCGDTRLVRLLRILADSDQRLCDAAAWRSVSVAES